MTETRTVGRSVGDKALSRLTVRYGETSWLATDRRWFNKLEAETGVQLKTGRTFRASERVYLRRLLSRLVGN